MIDYIELQSLKILNNLINIPILKYSELYKQIKLLITNYFFQNIYNYISNFTVSKNS